MRSDRVKRRGTRGAVLAAAMALAARHPAHAGAQPVSDTEIAAPGQNDATAAAPDRVGRPAGLRALGRRYLMDTALPVSQTAPGHDAQVITNVTAHATTQLAGFQTAPLPDENSQAPTTAASTDPSLRPAFFGRQTTFKGDGFMQGSDIETDQAHRQKPTGGLSLNIPVP